MELAAALAALLFLAASRAGDGHAAPTTAWRTIMVPGAGGREVGVRVRHDPTLADTDGTHRVHAVGPLHGRYRLLIDDHPSRRQGLSRCRAGRERWARLIDVRARREVYRRLVESCLTDIASADPLVRWDADGRGLTLRLLTPGPVHVALLPDGSAAER